MAEIKTVLPPLPTPYDCVLRSDNSVPDVYSADQMRAYAEAAVLSANAGKVDAQDEQLHDFIDCAAAEGMIFGGVDAAELYVRLFPQRYEDACKTPSPTQQAIDAPTAAERRYEIVRKMNVHQFTTLFKLNIAGEGRFDDLVDQLGQQAIDAGKA